MIKKITLTGNIQTDKLEAEIWDGCLILTTYDAHSDAPEAGQVVLLTKDKVDQLKAHIDQYYETLTTFNTLSGPMYGTREGEPRAEIVFDGGYECDECGAEAMFHNDKTDKFWCEKCHGRYDAD